MIAAHQFTPPGPGDIRGPCPGVFYLTFATFNKLYCKGMNAAANHNVSVLTWVLANF